MFGSVKATNREATPIQTYSYVKKVENTPRVLAKTHRSRAHSVLNTKPSHIDSRPKINLGNLSV